jgi:hypothetical protein
MDAKHGVAIVRGRATTSPPPLAGEGQGGGRWLAPNPLRPPPHPSPASGGGSRPCHAECVVLYTAVGIPA